jgi:two-component system, response regulator YesN
MYNLIIVDDEAEVRKGIIHKTKWETYGFRIAGEAENGREALDLIERAIPDVVITDIRMPVMDGMELAAILREKYPTIRIIILTGFDEFKYAQQAVKLDIVEYILKPVTLKDINELLLKLKKQLDEEVALREDMKALKAHYFQSFPVMRDKFLTALITKRMKWSEIDEKIRLYELNLSGNSCIVSAINLDTNTVKEGSFKAEDVDLARFAVLNIAEEIIQKYTMGQVFLHHDFIVVLLKFNTLEKESQWNRVFNVLNEIRMNIEKHLKFTVTIGIGNQIDDMANLGDSYKNAVAALDYRLIIGTNRVIYIGDLEQQYVEKVIFDENKEQLLKTSIKVGSVEDISATVDLLFKDLGDMKATFKDYQIYLLEILATITKVSKSLQLDTGEIFGMGDNLYAELYRFETIDEVKSWIKSICTRLMTVIVSKRQDTCKTLIGSAKEYVTLNYGDEDLTINKMCSILHISSSYFTSIFKKETGETFLNFLVRTRLEAAKELLLTTGMKTSEVAEKVGYPDPHYFSYFFKKNYGVSPKEFKNDSTRKSGERKP